MNQSCQTKARSSRRGHWIHLAWLLIVAGLLSTACRERTSEQPPIHLNPNMDDQIYFEAQQPNEFFALSADGRAMRPKVNNTVVAGRSGAYQRDLVADANPSELDKDTHAWKHISYDDDWLASDNVYYRGFGIASAAPAPNGAACKSASDCERGVDCANAAGQPVGEKEQGTCSKALVRSCKSASDCPDAIAYACVESSVQDPANGVCRPKTHTNTLPTQLTQNIGKQQASVEERRGAFLNFVERGKKRFDIYCAPCHGANGGKHDEDKGTGIVRLRGGDPTGIPSYHTDARRAYPIGRLYDIVTNGKGTMPPFASQIPIKDRWAIVAYVRVLQRSRHTALAELKGKDTVFDRSFGEWSKQKPVQPQ